MTITRLTFPVALLALAGATGCAGRYARWTENHTRNVVVYTDAKLEHAFTQEWLERSYIAYRAFFPDIDPGKLDAVWLKAAPGWLTRFFSPLDDPSAGWTLENLPSRSHIGRNGIVLLQRSEGTSAIERTFGVSGEPHLQPARDDSAIARQQMAYLLVNHAVPLAPLWLQVGLGRYFSRYRVVYDKRQARACFGSSWFDEPIALETTSGESRFEGGGRRALVEMRDLLDVDWYRYDGLTMRAWYEYTAYALVHYPIHGEGDFNRKRFGPFLRALRNGKTSEEALAIHYPQVLPAEWDQKLADYVRPKQRMLGRNHRPGSSLCLRVPREVEAAAPPWKPSSTALRVTTTPDKHDVIEGPVPLGALFPKLN